MDLYNNYKKAVREGDLEMLISLYNKGNNDVSFSSFLCLAIRYNKLNCVEFLSDKIYYYSECFKYTSDNIFLKRIIMYCCFKGNIEALKILLKKGYKLSIECLEKASSSGNIECLKYILSLNVININNNISITNRSGLSLNLDIVKFCLNNFKWNSKLLENASSKGFIACLEYICENYPIYKDYYFNSYKIIKRACKGGFLDCIKYVHYIHRKYKKTSILWDTKTVKICLKNNFLEGLKYLYDNGCKIKIEKLYSEDIECLKFLKEFCGLNSNMTFYACLKCNLSILKYLYENGCSLDKECLTIALEKGKIDCADYCYKNGAYWDPDNLIICIDALSYKGIEYSLNIPCEIDNDKLIISLYQEHVQELFYNNVNKGLIKLIYSIDIKKYPMILPILENIDYYLLYR
jgi:hypothetical protein